MIWGRWFKYIYKRQWIRTGKLKNTYRKYSKKTNIKKGEKILDAIIECNTKIVDYLYLIFNLGDSTYKSYKN